ncbi:hypothetical protein B0J17DRAFT_681726 [Rhizoctonia solani]|nr:hypothetical protein B0J17DRAFT_681726 [Rhizoctonia solani]
MHTSRVSGDSRPRADASRRLCILTLNEVDMLEAAWRISTLNLDSPQNLIYLGTDFHRAFDSHDWAFPAEEYDYTFVHLKGHPRRITREEVPLILPFQAEYYPYEIHHTPFSTFPLLRCQLHPYFAIYKAAIAAKLLTVERYATFRASITSPTDHSSVVSRLKLCQAIVTIWRAAPRPTPTPTSPVPTPRSVPSESRMTTRSQSAHNGAPSGSQRSSTHEGSVRLNRKGPQAPNMPPVTQGSSHRDCRPPSTMTFGDPLRTPDQGHALVDSLPLTVPDALLHLEIADWAKDVSSFAK